MIKFNVKGEYCQHCMEKFIEKAKTIDGVKDITFNFATEKVNLEVAGVSRDDVVENVKNLLNELEDSAHLEEVDDVDDVITSNNLSLKDIIEINKNDIIKIVAALLFFFASFLFKENIRFYLYLVSIIILGYELFMESVRNIKSKNFLDENFLMSLAAIGAFAIGEYVEAIFVLLLYTVGEIFENLTANNTKHSITKLMDLKQDYSNLIVGEKIEQVRTEDLNKGDIIRIKPFEKVPVDSVIIDGKSRMDTSSITGESMPITVFEGDEILSGYVNESGVLDVRVEKVFSDSTVSKILDMVQNATEKKSEAEKFITKFAKYYTPIVVFIAAIIAFVPTIIGLGEFNEFLYRALSFLVVSCPCAIIVSVPLAYFAGLGRASKYGVLIKGNNYLEALNDISVIAFDKTGTITKGKFGISSINTASDMNEDEIFEMIALAEANSNHPIANAILSSYDKEIDITRVKDYSEIPGVGIKCVIDGKIVIAGNVDIFEKYDIKYDGKLDELNKTAIYLAISKDYKGYITLDDEIKEDSKIAISKIRDMGIKTILLTGDKESVARSVSNEVGIDEYRSELLPNEKVEELEKIIETTDKNVVFIGDGINDAPVLKRADIGVSMGNLGQDAAIVASDIVLMTDKIKSFIESIEIANFTQKIVKQNIYFSIGMKILIMVLSTFGYTSLWLAVFGDVGVAILAILNSSRIIKTFD